MGLTEYKRKRNFRRTPEPAGNGKPTPGNLFVVQKHAASHLHYDFRLELGGTLKSWAVPKGPSLDPAVKSLAVHVEDHPLSYADFEGVIPQGEYGGGTVMVWDHGTWEPEGDALKAYKAGKLSFKLHGEKLKGKWSLVRMGGRAGDNAKNWLLIKSDDRSASKRKNVTMSSPKSVVSGRDMEEIAAARDRVWQTNGKAKKTSSRVASRKSAKAKKAVSSKSASPLATLTKKVSALPGAKKARQPSELKPQLATLATDIPRGENWLHEMKFDGYRMLAFFEDGKVRLVTRNGNDWTKKFPAIAGALEKFSIKQGILDGEVVSLNERGQPDFQQLQNLMKRRGDDSIVYYVFDMPHFGGYSLTGVSLRNRKEALSALLAAQKLSEDSLLRYSDHIQGQGEEVLNNACDLAMEGVVSKRIDSHYSQSRSPAWIKTKCLKRQEFVIGGYTKPRGSREGFGALLVGYFDQGKLLYSGRVGTGFNRASLRQVLSEMKKLKAAESPFADALRGADVRGVIWIKPELVCEVSFTEWTEEGLLRHPSFQGLREDKPAKEIVREKPKPLKQAIQQSGTTARKRPRRTAKI